MDFRSDNTAPAAPEILEAISRAGARGDASYGADATTAQLDRAFSERFETEVTVFPVITGTAANALALAQLVPPYGATYCHRLAHIEEHECGASELFTGGAKLLLVDGPDAKIPAERLAARLAATGEPGDEHRVRPTALSLTQATERGTVYRPAEIRALTSLARQYGLAVHMDGARFLNALVHLDCAPADITWRAGVDVLSYGGTKNGALAAEAIVFFDPARGRDLRYRQTSGGHLLSKMRFVSAQLLAGLEEDRAEGWARHANQLAQRLAAGLAGIEGCRACHPVEANMLWTTLPEGAIERLIAAGFALEHWRQGDLTMSRLVCSWCTRQEDVDRLVAIVAGHECPDC